MNGIKIMVNGLPGNMGKIISEALDRDERLELIPASLTGPGIDLESMEINGREVSIIQPENHKGKLKEIKDAHGEFIIVDYTHPTAVNVNGRLYCEMEIPFVMGTTGGDRDLLMKTVEGSGIPAVIAPNMAKQIVGFQAMMEFAAKNFPGLFEGYTMTLEESHQQGKADTSGTAKAMVGYFNDMGVEFDVSQIKQIRDPEVQKKELGVPEEYLGGHGWHTYSLLSPDKTVSFSFSHNINGRKVYCGPTADAVVYLDGKIREGAKGRVFSMIDVLKGA